MKVSRGKENTIKVDRNILQRLITAYRAGRDVNLENILQHELMTIPLSLATTDGSLHSTNKSVLANILTQQVETSANVAVDEASSCLLIDGQALVMALGKPQGIKTFGDFANIFTETVFKMGAKYHQRIDVVFDRYLDESIKSGTRVKRKQRHRPVRRKIENDSTVPLPSDWSSFTALEQIKQISRYCFQPTLLNITQQKAQ